MKKVLFIAYHHPKNKNSQSTALVRRISQYQKFFETKNWEVDYIVSENSECPDVDFGKGRVLQVKHQHYFQNRILNKIFIFFVIFFFGDIIGYSFFLRRKEIDSFLREDYDLVISFFSPRGTIWLGNQIKRKIKKPWWVDVQDSLDEGLSKDNFRLGMNWLKKKLKSADKIIHVSPEWKMLDENRIRKEILVQRHCIPDPAERSNQLDSFFSGDSKNKTKLFYAGNIHFQAMSPHVLKSSMNNSTCRFYYAGSSVIYEHLINLGLEFINLGRLEEIKLNSAYQNTDIVVVFAWNTNARQVIPSKFYEACAFHKPILIVGKDSGSFERLFNEWGHPNVVLETEEQVSIALEKYSKGDLSSLFIVSNCTKELSDKAQFTGFLAGLIDKNI